VLPNQRAFVRYLVLAGNQTDTAPYKATRTMAGGGDISALYREFTDALTEVLAETSIGTARRGRLARARAALKKHPNYNEHEYFLAVEAAFAHWEAIQNVGR
jgi:hypothetical protein